ncbi:MAG: hypothetical protein IV101_21265 [Dechloromonas sp.]|nr:hypothetical protein [Dechloromonas sp.]
MKQPTLAEQMADICLFPLGQIQASPGALDLLDRAEVNAEDLLLRHQQGDWGCVSTDDAEANIHAIIDGSRILSSYELLNTERLWIITEADRSTTTLLLPEEY